MLVLNLMNTLAADHLQFSDSAGCRRWIAELPLTNVESSQLALTRQIALVRQAVLAPLELMRILEALAEPAAYVQDELARKYAGKPQPLDATEAARWARVLELWQEFSAAYAVCRDAYAGGDPGVRKHGALIVMRCLRYTSCAMFEHYRVYRRVPGELWQQLHQLYAYAEQHDFARTVVADALNDHEADSSCAHAYRQALLVQLADPFALSGRQLDLLVRWAAQWAGLVNLAAEPLPPSAIPPLAVDLAGNRGPVLATGIAPQASLRFLALDSLDHTLRQLMTLLQQGQTPVQLGLGADARQPGCGKLLMLLYIQWCRAGTSRTEQRAAAEEQAQVCVGMRTAHIHISGQNERLPAAAPDVGAASWQLVNQSNAGLMCLLRERDGETRIGHQQLVCIRRSPATSFSLGMVLWLRANDDHELLAGVRLFPGSASAIAVRPVADGVASANGYERGLLLPGESAPSAPATLILPNGWYQPGRHIELRGERKQVARLDELLEKGSDFERCTFTLDPHAEPGA